MLLTKKHCMILRKIYMKLDIVNYKRINSGWKKKGRNILWKKEKFFIKKKKNSLWKSMKKERKKNSNWKLNIICFCEKLSAIAYCHIKKEKKKKESNKKKRVKLQFQYFLVKQNWYLSRKWKWKNFLSLYFGIE